MKQIILNWVAFFYTTVLKLKYKYEKKEKLHLNSERRERKIIISLTTIPSRIDVVWIVIERMFRQSVKPDAINLYLGEKEFEGKTLPRELKDLEERGLRIVFCEDLKPHTKYYYAMKEYSDDIIITVDDDIIYSLRLVEMLMKSYRKYPKAVSCMRAHEILFDNEKKVIPYNNWGNKVKGHMSPSMRLLATGVGGVLYPPHCMNSEVFEKEKLKELSFKADDIWLKIMQVINRTPVVKAQKGRGRLFIITSTQTVSLLSDNVNNSRNDEYLANLLKYYTLDLYKEISDWEKEN